MSQYFFCTKVAEVTQILINGFKKTDDNLTVVELGRTIRRLSSSLTRSVSSNVLVTCLNVSSPVSFSRSLTAARWWTPATPPSCTTTWASIAPSPTSPRFSWRFSASFKNFFPGNCHYPFRKGRNARKKIVIDFFLLIAVLLIKLESTLSLCAHYTRSILS